MQEASHFSNHPWKDHVEQAIRAAREAGRIQLEAYDRPHTIDFKGETNLVTDVDRACEETIHRLLRDAFPAHDFLMEESVTTRTDSPFLWVIDPLDGTTNYTHRYPHFCCSIALQHGEKTVLGVVYDPVREDLFTALAAGGAFLNGEPIRTSDEEDLIRCLLATGFPNEIKKARDKNLRKFARMLLLARSVRRSGSAALDLCYLAAGRLDGYWVLTLSPWDAAAGVLMIQEAGGAVTDLEGKPPRLSTQAFVASNGKIQEQLLSLLSPRKA